MHVNLALNNQLIETIEAEDLPFDSNLLGWKCARITKMESVSTTQKAKTPDTFYQPLVEAFAKQGFEYVIARRPAGEWHRYHLMENVGFRFIDQILGFRLTGSTPASVLGASISLRMASTADESAVAELSAKTFTRSRFHNDPLLSPETCQNVYRQWGINSVRGIAAQGVWLAESQGRLAGFITLKTQVSNQASLGSIDLIGVDPQHSGKGIGQLLVARGVEWLKAQGCSEVMVQTQSDNLAAIQLYTRMGFRADYSNVTLRWSSHHE